jgi:hypothetical protein
MVLARLVVAVEVVLLACVSRCSGAGAQAAITERIRIMLPRMLAFRSFTKASLRAA